MSKLFTEENLRARQKELKEELKAIEATTVPMREARDKFVQEHDVKLQEMNKALREAEAPLFELKQEAGMIAKALGGKALSRSAA